MRSSTTIGDFGSSAGSCRAVWTHGAQCIAILYAATLVFQSFEDFVPVLRTGAWRRTKEYAFVKRLLWTVEGKGNYWLFAPDPAPTYLHATVCTVDHVPRTVNGVDGCNAILFASYDGRLERQLDGGHAEPSRKFRLVENLLDLSSEKKELLSSFADYFRRKVGTEAGPVVVLEHELRLWSDSPRTGFVSSLAWTEREHVP